MRGVVYTDVVITGFDFTNSVWEKRSVTSVLKTGGTYSYHCTSRSSGTVAATNSTLPQNSNGHYIYHQVQHSAILRSVHTVNLCVLCGSENKQRLFPYTALTDWFV